MNAGELAIDRDGAGVRSLVVGVQELADGAQGNLHGLVAFQPIRDQVLAIHVVTDAIGGGSATEVDGRSG